MRLDIEEIKDPEYSGLADPFITHEIEQCVVEGFEGSRKAVAAQVVAHDQVFPFKPVDTMKGFALVGAEQTGDGHGVRMGMRIGARKQVQDAGVDDLVVDQLVGVLIHFEDDFLKFSRGQLPASQFGFRNFPFSSDPHILKIRI
jgi:hypothetical protein